MERKHPPQQLDLPFELNPMHSVVAEVTTELAAPASESNLAVLTQPAIVIDFNSALSRQKSETQSSIYRQILESVRHIG